MFCPVLFVVLCSVVISICVTHFIDEEEDFAYSVRSVGLTTHKRIVIETCIGMGMMGILQNPTVMETDVAELPRDGKNFCGTPTGL